MSAAQSMPWARDASGRVGADGQAGIRLRVRVIVTVGGQRCG
jgi:hypothetical protein